MSTKTARSKIQRLFPTFYESFTSLKTVDSKWVTVWCLIYGSFILLDVFFPRLVFYAALIKYIGIFLCLAYVWAKFGKDYRLVIAIGLTLLADTILIVLNAKVAGVFVFCFAQFFHTIRLSRKIDKNLLPYFLLIFGLFIFCLLQSIPTIYMISFIYASSLVMNVFLAYRWYIEDSDNLRASHAFCGMVLFLLCDMCVAISFVGATQGLLPPFIVSITNVLIFIFYYPSQILICNSSTEKIYAKIKP